MTERELAELPNYGPASARWLVGAGISTVTELRRVGPVAAFHRVSVREGRAATANLLYALYAALEDKHFPLSFFPLLLLPPFPLSHAGVAFRMARPQA